MKKSNSTAAGIPLSDKIREWCSLFLLRWHGRGNVSSHVAMLRESFAEYEEVCHCFASLELSNAKVFEVGFGARPLRLMWFLEQGIDAFGIDLDEPILKGKFAEFTSAYRRNGPQRALKSFVRYQFFDRREWNLIFDDFRSLPSNRFIVGDASTYKFDREFLGNFDFVYCEDVLEHVPRNSIPDLLATIRRLVKPQSVILLRPHVFTSIGGGHLTEWYPYTTRGRLADETCRSEPWEHLRKKRFRANTYLNELRLDDYRSLISEHFNIEEEKFHDMELGERFLTSDIENELSDYSREELLANTVRFICTPKR